MGLEEILRILSENHRLLILGGGILSVISLFLPFYKINVMFSYDSITMGYDQPLSSTWLFWIFLIVLAVLFYGYFKGYGDQYPYLFLAAGSILVILTLYGTQLYTGGDNLISVLWGFFFECIGSLAVAVGGWYYYQEHQA